MIRVKFAVLAAVAAVLAGCASGPAYKDVVNTFQPVPTSEGRIYFYRTATMGAAIQPDVKVNGEKVGAAVPKGFFYVDRAAGDYTVTTATELKKSLTLRLEPGQTRYVRLNISMGLMVGHVYPELVDEAVGKAELEKTKFTATK